MSGAGSTPPNIVLFVTDQQSATMLNCAGNEHLETPAMDRIAEAGTRFERAYCTNPVCAPSRFSLMTGRYPSAIDLRSNDFSHLDGVPSAMSEAGFGHRLRDAGYETVHGGKFGVPTLTPEDLGLGQLTTDRRAGLADDCVSYIEQQPDEPFFLVASFINPRDICYHAIRDYQRTTGEWSGAGTAEEMLDQAVAPPSGCSEAEFVNDRCPPLPSNHSPQANEPGGIAHLLDKRPFRRYVREEWTDEDWRRHRWAYCRLTERVDQRIDRILDALERTGLRDEALVCITSDHGDHDGAHRLEHKTVPYEEAARVPLLVDPPTADARSQVERDHLVSNGLDLVPTICDYAGVDSPPSLSGRSLRPLIRGETVPAWRDQLRIEFEVGDALVTDRYKYVQYVTGAHQEQLYDLADDPGETRNTANDPGIDEVTTRMRERLAVTSGG